MIRVVLENKRCKTPPTFISSIDLTTTKGASLGLDTCLKICIFLSNFRDIFSLPGQYGYSYCSTPQPSRGNNKNKLVTEENKGVFVWEAQNAFHKAQRSHLYLSTANGTAFL